MTDAVGWAEARFGDLVGEPVVVTFSDGGTESGVLVLCGWDLIRVELCDMEGGGHFWTEEYTLIGDADTPHVVSVAPAPVQTEVLFA